MYPLTLIIDGNYLFYKTLNVAKGYSREYNENNKYLNNSKDVGIFARKVSNDFLYSLNQFSGYERIIFTKDTKSWRKDVNIPLDGHPGYKGSRKGMNDVNMKIFYKIMDDFCEIIKQKGIIIANINRAEGDDLMHLWAHYLNTKKNPENVIIFTGDGDISQLVNYNDNVYTAIFSNRSAKNIKIIAKNGFKKWILSKKDAPADIFNMTTLNKIMSTDGIDVMKIAMEKIPIEEIDPLAVSLEKILCGDDGDDIPSSWNWVNKNGTKIRITNKHFRKVYDYLKSKYGEIDIYELINNESYKNRIRIKIQDISKINIPKDEFYNRLNLNIKLAYLDYEQFPLFIVDEFNNTKEKLLKENKLEYFDKLSLLKDTKYEKTSIGIQSDLFKLL